MLAATLVFFIDISRLSPLFKADLEKDGVTFVIHQDILSFQILHAMKKIPEDEIWQSEPESVVCYILFH